LRTYSQGLTKEGYFLDTWPAFDRLARLMERQLDLTPWGPVLDHSIGFVFDNWNHYLHTGDLAPMQETFPRLLAFCNFLRRLQTSDGLLPVENLGVPSVWIDHNAYQKQRHKHCAFNLYAAAMLRKAMRPLAEALGENKVAQEAETLGRQIEEATIKRYWSEKDGIFINNLPWLAEEGQMRACDRSLANAIIYDQCPGGKTALLLDALEKHPAYLGLSYPANTIWRYWALSKGGRIQAVINEWRDKWWNGMASIHSNNTLAEDFNAKPDSWAQWSHCPIAPIVLFCDGIAGIVPQSPAYERVLIKPQLGDLPGIRLVNHTVKGHIVLDLKQNQGKLSGKIVIPPGVNATLQWNGTQRELRVGEQTIE
jgi:alpha-L-rhamnosidase